MINKNLANELVAVGGWIAVIAAFLTAIGSTGQVEPDQSEDTSDVREQLKMQRKQLQKQQIQLQLIQLQQELNNLKVQQILENR